MKNNESSGARTPAQHLANAKNQIQTILEGNLAMRNGSTYPVPLNGGVNIVKSSGFGQIKGDEVDLVAFLK